jgi:hypothetical protein
MLEGCSPGVSSSGCGHRRLRPPRVIGSPSRHPCRPRPSGAVASPSHCKSLKPLRFLGLRQTSGTARPSRCLSCGQAGGGSVRGPRPRVGSMVRPESWIRPAGVSPAWVGTGAPSSRPRFVGEIWRAERGVESLFGGSKITGRSGSEHCSLVKLTMGEPSRSCHGEGHVRRALFRGQPGGSSRGRGGGT